MKRIRFQLLRSVLLRQGCLEYSNVDLAQEQIHASALDTLRRR